jgi:peptide/nickel transport system substrate-binding protein
LRQGVTWHDGQTFSSDDVKFTFEQILAKYHPRTQTLMKRVKSIETPDANTVVMTLNDAYAPFLLQMSVFDAPILPKHLYENTDILKNPYNSKPVGTGPFKFSEWNRGTSIKVVKNDKYWDQGKPYLDSIIFQIVPQGVNRSTGLETGELDFVIDYYLAKADVKRLSANSSLQSKRGQGAPAIDFLMMNNKTPALSTKEARQAIALVVDRQRLVDQAMGGLGRPGKGPFGDGFKWLLDPASDYSILYPKDLAKAKSLLSQASVSGGNLRLVYDSARPQFVSGGQIIKENLQQLGFTVDLQPLERSAMLQKVFTNRDYDLTLQSFISSSDPSIGYHRLYLTNTTNTNFLNATGYSNPQVDELLNKAAVTVDQAQRAVFYKQAEAILAVDLPSLVLFDEEGIDFATKKLTGLWLSSDSRDRWDNVSQS